ncbi:MAG TPA: septum formation initiator family protein [Alphaproteobacteria bacterium]|nr:septum formation initiator family protein [Alphaproteobacteria bacterium]
MNFVGEIRRRARHIVGPILGITLFAYFAYHAVQGDRGLIAWLKLSQQVETAQMQYDKVRARREAFAHRVSLLEPNGLDPDMLEERARVELGLSHPDDIIILSHSAPAVLHDTEATPDMALPEPEPAASPTPPPLEQPLDRKALDELIGNAIAR